MERFVLNKPFSLCAILLLALSFFSGCELNQPKTVAEKYTREIENEYFQNFPIEKPFSQPLDAYLYEHQAELRKLSVSEKQSLVFFILTRIGTDAGATYALVEVFENDWPVILKYLHQYDEEFLHQRGVGERRIENYIRFITQLSKRIEKGLPIL